MWLAERPEEVALVTPSYQLTWRELDYHVGRLAASLYEQGLSHGEVITLIGKNQPEMVLLFLAALKIGAVTAMVMPQPLLGLRDNLTTLYRADQPKWVWFGGGSDLNPCIEYDEDTAHFHATQKAHLDPHGTEIYPKLKEWADEYFYIPHRHRARGVGGIFMDDRNTGDWEADFTLTQDIGRAFLPAYLPLVEKRRVQPFDDKDKEAQLVHRGLYAEYNLVYDRGTLFGLKTGGNIDAILMSLPPEAVWT